MEVFIGEKNKRTLWDVISDTDLQLRSGDVDNSQLQRKFLKCMSEFYDEERREKRFSNLRDMNKQFIVYFIKENKVPEKNFIKAEEFKVERLQNFEKKWKEKEDDFSHSFNIPIPETPQFSETKDKPIEGMENLLAKIMQERKYDLEQIHPISNKEELQQFLQTQETSLNTKKNKKISANPITKYNVPQVKFIQIGEENEISIDAIPLSQESHVSWSDSIPSDSIFSKLKPLTQEKHPKVSGDDNRKLDYILQQLDILQQENQYIKQLLEKITETTTVK